MQKVNSIILVLFTCLLIAYAVIVKPTGEIHTSVLTITGELLSASLAFEGIKNWKDKHDK